MERSFLFVSVQQHMSIVTYDIMTLRDITQPHTGAGQVCLPTQLRQCFSIHAEDSSPFLDF